MQIKVKFFAIFREAVGKKTDSLNIDESTTVEGLWEQYVSQNPRLQAMRAAYAVNQKLVSAEHVLQDGDEVGFLPPVSGGAKTLERENTRKERKPRKTTPKTSSRPLRLRGDTLVTPKPLNTDALVKRVAFSGAGAIITFIGVVRDNSQGKSVRYLEYEAYPEMAEQNLRELIAEVKERWSDVRVAIAHRIGKVKIGEASLVIAVAAPHRPEAYQASRYTIERIKAVLPVWKKEFATDGESWVEGPIAGEIPPEKAEEIARGEITK
jgi:molybdopterin synthase catalytic subunit